MEKDISSQKEEGRTIKGILQEAEKALAKDELHTIEVNKTFEREGDTDIFETLHFNATEAYRNAYQLLKDHSDNLDDADLIRIYKILVRALWTSPNSDEHHGVGNYIKKMLQIESDRETLGFAVQAYATVINAIANTPDYVNTYLLEEYTTQLKNYANDLCKLMKEEYPD